MIIDIRKESIIFYKENYHIQVDIFDKKTLKYIDTVTLCGINKNKMSICNKEETDKVTCKKCNLFDKKVKQLKIKKWLKKKLKKESKI
ncbi:hypothetical protein [Flavobacterium psychrophilum]|uniref:hypothetical protein n=1 Tax=Flavobacterium psychrophilum TaxID=96345 RepID=UPI00106C19CD|nr:hypothetical protein [Flavobacterium psychrophilum]